LAANVVNSTTVAYDRMTRRWGLPDTLMGGTVSMREAGEKYLPKEPREQQRTWQNRLNRSILFNAYEDTLKKVSAKPFEEPITIKNEEKLDPRLSKLPKNVDMQGNSLTQFGNALFKNALHRGLIHVYIDYPTVDLENPPTLSQEIEGNIRPYFTQVDPIDLPAWRSRVMPSGERMLAQVRLLETEVIPDGDFGEKVRETIRVVTAPDCDDLDILQKFIAREIDWRVFVDRGGELGEVRVFERVTQKDEDLPENKRSSSNFEDSKFEEVTEEGGAHTYPGIPLRTLYINKTGFMTAEPPFEDLAWLNLAHWQSMSDQRNILRFARVGILFMTGLSKQEMEKELVVGPTQMWRSTNPEAKLTHVEHSGASIEAGERDLKELERRMEVLGLQPFVESAGNVTATARSIDTSKEQAAIKSWVRGLELLLEQCFECASIWLGVELPDDFAVDVFSEFSLGMKASTDTDQLIKLRDPINPNISHKTLIAELKRRGLLSDDVDSDEEMERIAEEGGGIDRFLESGIDPVTGLPIDHSTDHTKDPVKEPDPELPAEE